MKGCPTEHLPDYRSGSLDREKMEEIRRHIRDCEGCSETLELFEALDRPVPDPGSAYWASLPAEVLRKAHHGSWWTGRAYRVAAGLAAAAAVALVAAFWQPSPKKALLPESDPYGSQVIISLGLEEELHSLAGSERALAEGPLALALNGSTAALTDNSGSDPLGILLDSEFLDSLPPGTVDTFEGYIDELTLQMEERG